jgi:hypothetical protein
VQRHSAHYGCFCSGDAADLRCGCLSSAPRWPIVPTLTSVVLLCAALGVVNCKSATGPSSPNLSGAWRGPLNDGGSVEFKVGQTCFNQPAHDDIGDLAWRSLRCPGGVVGGGGFDVPGIPNCTLRIPIRNNSFSAQVEGVAYSIVFSGRFDSGTTASGSIQYVPGPRANCPGVTLSWNASRQ